MKDKQKLLYVINHIDWFWSHRLPLAKAAQESGYDVHIAVPHASADPELKAHNFNGHDLPQGVFAAIRKLRKIIVQEQPDIIHAITIKHAFITGLATLGLKTPRIIHTIAGLGYLFSGEGLKPRLLRLIIGPFLRLALRRKNTRLIFQNPDDMSILISRNLADPHQSHLIRGSGVDVNQFKPQQQTTTDTPIVLMPTRLVHDKGVSIFVQAARILKARSINAKFQIAGGISQNNPLAITQTEMEAMIADGAVEWLGKVSDMPHVLNAATLIAYPSHYREGIPKVLLEAAACGKPIVTTDHAGCCEAVTHGENGLLVPVKDPQALAAAIETLLHDPETCKKMGQKSRQRAENEFNVNLIVAQTLKVYAA
jgi:glycosyltransferase involved in cell wall biosynthesis